MGGLWILCAVMCSSISLTHQEIIDVRTSKQLPVEVREGDKVKLPCTIKATEPPVLVQWLLDDEVATNGTYVVKNSYNVTLSLKKPTVFSYHLSIASVNRTDHGRWTCRAFGDATQFKKINIILIVFYTPDSMYPICGLQGTSVACQTQEGNPRVSLNWYAQRSLTDRFNLKPSSLSTEDGVIESEVSMISLRPPNWARETVVCDTGIGVCSVSKLSVYNTISLNISTEFVNNEVIVHCNSSYPLEDGTMVIERNDTSIVGKMTQGADYATLRFFDGGYGYRKEIIYCRYLWGILDGLHEEMEIDVPYPPPIPTTFVTPTDIVTEFDNDDALTTSTDELTTQKSLRTTLLTSPKDVETSSQRAKSTTTESTFSSTLKDGNDHSGSMGLSTVHDDDEELTTFSDIATERDHSTSSIGEGLTTLVQVKTERGHSTSSVDEKLTTLAHVTTERDESTSSIVEGLTTLVQVKTERGHSTSSIGEELTTTLPQVITKRDDSTSSIVGELTTLPHVTAEKDGSTSSIADTTLIFSTAIRTIDNTETSKATNSVSKEMRTTKHVLVTDEPTTRFRKPTIPLLPPEENQSPSKPENITLIVLFVVAIIVISLVAVIIYQKWKEKTGSYSLPTTTSSKAKGSPLSYKHNC